MAGMLREKQKKKDAEEEEDADAEEEEEEEAVERPAYADYERLSARDRISGTIFDAAAAILRIPPTITAPTAAASSKPNSQPRVAK